jgi:hypothetical protein
MKIVQPFRLYNFVLGVELQNSNMKFYFKTWTKFEFYNIFVIVSINYI